jgi:hypothetical protein
MEQLVLRGTLEGHNGWVTSLATSLEKCAKEIEIMLHQSLTSVKPEHASFRKQGQDFDHLESHAR